MIIHDVRVQTLVEVWRGNELVFFLGVSKKRLPERKAEDFTIASTKLKSGPILTAGWRGSTPLVVIFSPERAPREGEVISLLTENKKGRLTYLPPEGFRVIKRIDVKVGFITKEEEL